MQNDGETVTIYCINETDRTIDIAQSVNEDNESVRAAILNARTFTFDEILRQHLAFRDSGTLVENCRNRFLSALHIGNESWFCSQSDFAVINDRPLVLLDKTPRSFGVPVNADDMLAGFTADNESWFCSCSPALGGNDCLGCLADKTPRSYGENVFLRGMMTAAHELYDEERAALSAPNDVLLATLNKSRIQAEISAKINTFFDSNFGAIGDAAYFDCGQKLNAFAVLHSETVIFCDD